MSITFPEVLQEFPGWPSINCPTFVPFWPGIDEANWWLAGRPKKEVDESCFNLP